MEGNNLMSVCSQQQDLINKTEEEFQEKLKNFMETWESKTKEFDDHANQLRAQLSQSQVDELEKLHKNLETTLRSKAKFSTTVLNLRKRQEQLAKIHQYKEAQDTLLQVQKLEEIEQECWNQKRDQKIAASESKMVNKHKIEKEALEKRILSGIEELMGQKEKEHQRMEQRLNNLKRDIENKFTSQQKKCKPGIVALNTAIEKSIIRYSPSKQNIKSNLN